MEVRKQIHSNTKIYVSKRKLMIRNKKNEAKTKNITAVEARQLAESTTQNYQRLNDILTIIRQRAEEGKFTLLIHFELTDFEIAALEKRSFEIVRSGMPFMGAKNRLFQAAEIRW